MQFQWLVSMNRRERVGFLKRPTIDKAVVARRTLHVDAQKRLRDVLSKLHVDGLAAVDGASPFNSLYESFAVTRRGNQFTNKLIVGFIIQQRTVQPICDLLSSARDRARSRVSVSQQVIPKRQPVFCVVKVVGLLVAHFVLAEQLRHQMVT